MKLKLLSTLVFAAIITFSTGCKKDPDKLSASLIDTEMASSKSTSLATDYNIAVNVSTDGKVWTYTITRANPKAKNLSHFIINLDNCGAESAVFGNINSATVNGLPADLSPTEGSGTGCNPSTTNFVKFDNLPSSTTGWTLVFTLERGYTMVDGKAWNKAGTSCWEVLTKVPGCPIPETVYCSFSQGYFFGNGSINNGAVNYFTSPGLVIGGVSYSYVEGQRFWDIDKGQGSDQTMNAFFQLAAVTLSGVQSHVAADAAIINAYFSGINVNTSIITVINGKKSYLIFSLPATVTSGDSTYTITKAQVQAAGSRISEFIQANHCQ